MQRAKSFTSEENPTPTSDADRLQAYLLCEKAILSGNQSYSMDGMGTFTRADLGRVQTAIADLKQSVALAAVKNPTVGGIVSTRVVF